MKRADIRKEYPKLVTVESYWPTGVKSSMLGISYNSYETQLLVAKARYQFYSFHGKKKLIKESLYGTSYSNTPL